MVSIALVLIALLPSEYFQLIFFYTSTITEQLCTTTWATFEVHDPINCSSRIYTAKLPKMFDRKPLLQSTGHGQANAVGDNFIKYCYLQLQTWCSIICVIMSIIIWPNRP